MIRQLLADYCYRLALWLVHLGRGSHTHAYRLLLLAQWLRPSPRFIPWLNYLGAERLLAAGEGMQAVELLRQATHELGHEPMIWANLGLAYSYTGRDLDAVSALEKSLREGPASRFEEVWSALAWSYLHSGRAPKARETCWRAAQVGIRSPRLDLLVRLAGGVQAGVLPTGDIADLLRAVPGGTPLLLEYARMQAQASRHRLARSAIAALPPEMHLRSFLIIGQASLAEEDPQTAIWAAEQVLRSRESAWQPEAEVLLAESQVRKGNLEAALGHARKALLLEPTSGRAHEQLGRVLLLTGQWEEAVGEMIEALHTGGAGALAAALAALAAIELGDLRGAHQIFEVERTGDALAVSFAHVAQARLMAAEEQYDKALELGQAATDELHDLPLWAADPVALQRLCEYLHITLETIAADADHGSAAEALLSRLESCRKLRASQVVTPS